MNILGVLPHPQFGPWQLGPLEIHSFGLVLAIGLVVGVIGACRRAERTMAVSAEKVQNLGLWLIVFGFIFSHLFEVVTYQPEVFREVGHLIATGVAFQDPGAVFDVWPLGTISSVGGLFGGGIAYLLWMYRNPDLDRLQWANLSAWTVAICFFFGRLGCTLAFDHPGQKASEFGLWNWLVDKTGGVLPELFPLAMQFPEQWGGGIRHNLGFYEALWWLVIMGTFLILSRKPRRRGLYLWLLPLMYAPFRFFLDFLRAMPDEVAFGGDPRYLGLTPAQYSAIVILALGIFAWWKLRDEDVEEWKEYEPDPDES